MSDATDFDAEADTIEGFEKSKREADETTRRNERNDLSDVFHPAAEQGWLDGEPSELTSLVADDHDVWMPRGKVGSLIAPGSTGKTQLLLQLAMCIASDNPNRRFLGRFKVPSESRGPVVLGLGEEGGNDIHRRISHVLDHWSDPNGDRAPLTDDERDAIGQRLYALGMADKRTALMQQPIPPYHVKGELDRQAKLADDDETGHEWRARRQRQLLEGWTDQYQQWRQLLESPPGWDRPTSPDWKAIIIDPASQFIGPEVEQDSAAATRFVELLNTWARRPWGNDETGPTVLTAHHASQNAAQKSRDDFLTFPHASRGSTALTAGVRWQANMYATNDCPLRANSGRMSRDIVSLHINKFNDAGGTSRFHMKRIPDSPAMTRVKRDIIWPDDDDE